MRCIVCDKTEWENVDHFRMKKEGMSLCKSCGFVSYPEKWKEKEKVLEFYRKEYRKPPTVENLYQGQRKLQYHQEFLTDPVLEGWIKEGKKDPAIFEVGAAYGIVLAWFKNMRKEGELLFPNASLNGSELTTSFKRNAYHEYGFNLVDDFDDSKTYDLIMSYKVAEHMLDADLELIRYRKALKPGGKLYISVPTWFFRLHNFGAGGFSLEYYYAPAHVNVWSRPHFEAILKKAGLKIVKSNHSFYDDTYLCEDAKEPARKEQIPLPSPDQVREWLERIKKADELCLKKDFQSAVEIWPNFPTARRATYEYARKEWHEKGIDEIVKCNVLPWIQVDPENHEAYVFAADILMRYGKYDEALNYLKTALAKRPKDESSLGAVANCYRMLAKKAETDEKKVYFIAQARDIMRYTKEHCLSSFANSMTWVYSDNAQIPIP